MIDEEAIEQDEPLSGEVGILIMETLQAHGAMPMRHIEKHLDARTKIKRRLKLNCWRLREQGLLASEPVPKPLQGYRLLWTLTPAGSVLIETFNRRLKGVRRDSQWTRSDRK